MTTLHRLTTDLGDLVGAAVDLARAKRALSAAIGTEDGTAFCEQCWIAMHAATGCKAWETDGTP